MNVSESKNTSKLLNPKIFTNNYNKFLHENKKFIFRKKEKNVECYLGTNNEKASKEFKLKTEELKKSYNEIKKRETKKHIQENEMPLLTIIENNFTIIQNSSLTIEEKQKLYLQYFFSVFNILSNTQQQFLFTYDTQRIFNILYLYSPSQNETTIIQKYEWFYMYTNHFSKCYEISKGNSIMVFNFFLKNILYENKEINIKRKLEMIISFYPFIENCMLLYISAPSKNELCLLIVEIFVDGIIYQLLILFTKTNKTIKPLHFAMIWQLLLEVLLPYLSNCVDFLPENEGLIEKIFLCFSFLRAYYGSIRKILKFARDYKLIHDISIFQNKYEKIYYNSQQYYLVPNMFEWNFFPDNIVITLTKFINSQHNYCRYLFELLSFFDIANDETISQRKKIIFDDPAYFNKYYKCAQLELKEMGIQISQEEVFPSFINANEYNSFYSSFLNPLLIDIDKLMFSNVIKKLLNIYELKDIYQRFSLSALFNIYCGVLILLSKLIFLIPNEENIQFSFRIEILKKLNKLLESNETKTIPVIEILAFIETLLQAEITEQEIKIVINILSKYKNHIYPTFFFKGRINDFMNELCEYLFLHCSSKKMLHSENDVISLIDILYWFIHSNKKNVGKHLLKLYYYLGMNFGCDIFKKTFDVIISQLEKVNNDPLLLLEVYTYLFSRWKEMYEQNENTYKEAFELIENFIASSFIRIFRIILATKYSQISEKQQQQFLINVCIDLLCEVIAASQSKVNKLSKSDYTFIYESLIIDICTIEQKISNDISTYLKQDKSKIDSLNMENLTEDKYLEIQLKAMFKLLHLFNQIKHRDKMKFLIDTIFPNHSDSKKEIHFKLFVSEIVSYMYIDKHNEIYFDNPYYYSNNNLNEPCLYGNSVNGSDPPENAIILNTTKILSNILSGLSSKTYKYQKLKLISTGLSHIYLLNDKAIKDFIEVIKDFSIFKGLLQKERVILIFLDIFTHLITLVKSQNSLFIKTKHNYIEKDYFTFFCPKSKEKQSIQEQFFNLITKYLDHVSEKFCGLKKQKQTEFIVNVRYIFGCFSFYLNSLLTDKYPNYMVSKEIFKKQKKGNLHSYLDDYITKLVTFYLAIKDINLTLPLLYALFTTKEFVVAFNYEDMINYFWLCFVIRWPKYAEMFKEKFQMKTKLKFEISSLKVEQDDQIKIIYLSEFLCYYYLQYLPDDTHNEHKIYNEIIDIFLTNKENYTEDEVFTFLDYCQTMLFNKEHLGKNGLDDSHKNKIITNIDNAMIFSSNRETVIINNEQILDKENINERKLNILIISPSANTSLLIEDYLKYNKNNKEEKSWQEGIRHLLFDISNFTKYPNQLFTHITNLKDEHKQIITNLLSSQTSIFKIPVLFVPFSKHILSHQNIFPINEATSPKPLSFSKLISKLGTITHHSQDSLQITHNIDLFTIQFDIMINQLSIRKQTDIIIDNHIHIIYIENPNQPFGSFDNLYDNKHSKEQILYIYIIITDIGNEHYLIRRRYNDVSLVDKYLDEVLRDNYIINLHSYSGIRYFMNSLILLKEMNKFKNISTCENKFKQRLEMIKKINQYYIENK